MVRRDDQKHPRPGGRRGRLIAELLQAASKLRPESRDRLTHYLEDEAHAEENEEGEKGRSDENRPVV
jgi:hypothetical protein